VRWELPAAAVMFRTSSRVADTFVCAYPNAGLPNAFGEYDETAEETAEILRDFAGRDCSTSLAVVCGTTPQHIRLMSGR